MREYKVSIERNGTQVLVGKIVGETYEDACFFYEKRYLGDVSAVPLSLSLPLQQEAYSAKQTKTFFDGLLPEGFTRRSVAQWMHLDENDYLAILCRLGRECLGAIRITDDEESVEASYERISEQQVRDLAAEGTTKSAELVTKSHLSLTGASGKVGLYYDHENGVWYLPRGSAPSTHIVKQSHVRLDGIVTNEQLSLLTAQKCGIEVPESFIINMGNGRDEDVLFATKRFDRTILDPTRRISGLSCPMRLHQEDFAQALGIPAAKKYEEPGDEYLRRMFELLRRHSADPITDMLKLWDMVVFDFLIGNTDAHVKNFSLLYSPDMRRIRLAPAYDIVSTAVYSESTRDLSLALGGEYSLDKITETDFLIAASDAGLGGKMALNRLNQMCRMFCTALEEATDELYQAGYVNVRKTAQAILERGGISRLSTGLHKGRV